MNKQSNTYTFIYASVMVILVASILAFTALSLKPTQKRNIEIDKKMQILSSAKISSTTKDAEEKYAQYITNSYIVNHKGEVISGDAFSVELEKELIKPVEKQQLPVFEFKVDNGDVKYILPMRGKGLWGPVWGYISLNADKNTIYGVYFSHKSETPGLGAEIATENFQKQFDGKEIFKRNEFVSIAVLKVGTKSQGQDAVDGISGGTITSKSVEAMLKNCLQSYVNFLNKK
jgi:Na+-transporting NADH:ubiquinone oxidoreductase subunit C